MRVHLLLLLVPALTGSGRQAASAPEDSKSIDSIIAALYDTISGPANKERDWPRFRALLASDAQMSAVIVARSGAAKRYPVNVDDYIRLSGPLMKERGFFEKETSRKQEQFGKIAHVFSSYESREKLTDKSPFEKGVNSIQLWNDGKRWWIQSIMWQGEPPTKTYLR